jgi:hypothetical protein
MIFGKPITMTKEEVLMIARQASNSNIITVHLEEMNHCSLKREELKNFMIKNKMNHRVIIPKDGEVTKIQHKR